MSVFTAALLPKESEPDVVDAPEICTSLIATLTPLRVSRHHTLARSCQPASAPLLPDSDCASRSPPPVVLPSGALRPDSVSGKDTDAVVMARDAGVGDTGVRVPVGEAESDAVADRELLLDPDAVLLAVRDAVADAVADTEAVVDAVTLAVPDSEAVALSLLLSERLTEPVGVAERLVLPERLAVAV